MMGSLTQPFGPPTPSMGSMTGSDGVRDPIRQDPDERDGVLNENALLRDPTDGVHNPI